jgi:hypothetical protein
MNRAGSNAGSVSEIDSRSKVMLDKERRKREEEDKHVR